MSHRRTEETELILVLWAAIKGVQQFVNTADGTAQQHFDRRQLVRQYQEGTQPKVPTTPQPTQGSALLVLQLWLSIENSLGGIPEIPNGTKLLLAANCLPFLNRTGFSLPIFGHQPFMIWEHKQLYRLVTSTFLHSDLKHLVANLGSLVQSGSWLEAKSGVTKFAASVTSLGLAASFLDALYSRICYQQLGDKQGYFLQTSVGASGLCFGLQVVANYTQQGAASVMNLTTIPVRFSCWSHLVVTQALLSCDHVSFKGHLSGILAGLLHVFLPKAAKQLHSASRGQKQQPSQHQPWHSCLSAHTRSQSPVIEEVKWSDLPVHAVCAVLAVGGHQLLRIVRKRRQRGAAGGDDSSRRHTHERQGQPVRNRLQGRSRLSGNHPRFL